MHARRPHALSLSPTLAAAFLIVGLSLRACGSSGSQAGEESANPGDESSPLPEAEVTATTRPVGNDVGYQAPPFKLPLLSEGDDIELSSLRGKVVIITFWASWCGPCRVEVPALEAAWLANRDKGLVVLGISLDDTEDMAKRFLSFFPVTYPMALDQGGAQVGNTWGVGSIPLTLVVDSAGVIRKKHLGYTPDTVRDLMAEVDGLLRETVQ